MSCVRFRLRVISIGAAYCSGPGQIACVIPSGSCGVRCDHERQCLEPNDEMNCGRRASVHRSIFVCIYIRTTFGGLGSTVAMRSLDGRTNEHVRRRTRDRRSPLACAHARARRDDGRAGGGCRRVELQMCSLISATQTTGRRRWQRRRQRRRRRRRRRRRHLNRFRRLWVRLSRPPPPPGIDVSRFFRLGRPRRTVPMRSETRRVISVTRVN